ncbi:cytochrome P450 734A1 isoform X1 [Lactuca sativa]|uniref:cytochrome P450 734A1 isoform X1 n=2 Tax=Lactuca sativa TaxID=4236 RepID=UPI000CD96BDB|nr:cytochrome P450 734A1 isoform X1 [Lactuca sativa]
MKGEMVFVILQIVVLLIIVKVFLVIWWKPKKIEKHFSEQGIKGPPYCLLIGNAKEMVSFMVKASSQPMPFSHHILPRVLSFYHHWKKIYGPTFLIWFGPMVRLTVADPDLIREVFCSKSELYEKNEAHPLIKQLEGDGLLSLKGEKWALHRKIITPTFHMDNLKLLVPVATCSVVKMLDKWLDMSDSGEVEIEVSECYQNLTKETMTRIAFGNINYEYGKHIFQLQTRQMVLTSEAFQKISIPGYRFFPTKRNRECWKLQKEIKKRLMRVIERRREKWEDDELENGPKDLLGVMIEASRKESLNFLPAITASDIAEECKSFFFAGEQTTSNLLTWTTVLLAMHPQWQVIARDEVLSVCGPRDIPTKDCVSKFKMLTMILNESLRLYPPIVASIRRAKADVELGGYKIPRGTELLIPILAIHHDQTIWGDDVNEFNPSRFSDGIARAAKHPVAFIPFGLGVRTCIGQNLAILQAKLTISIILQRFSFKLSPKYQHAPTVLMLLHPQYGAPIVFKHLRTDRRSKGNQGS